MDIKAAMYIFINKGLRMSSGKIGAQAGHAAVEAYRLSEQAKNFPMFADEDDPAYTGARKAAQIMDAWYLGGHYAKYIMECRDTEHLLTTERYLKDRGFTTVLIIDEGHTEIPPLTPTALGVALVDKNDPHTAATFSSFDLYREPRPAPENEDEEWTAPGGMVDP